MNFLNLIPYTKVFIGRNYRLHYTQNIPLTPAGAALSLHNPIICYPAFDDDAHAIF